MDLQVCVKKGRDVNFVHQTTSERALALVPVDKTKRHSTRPLTLVSVRRS